MSHAKKRYGDMICFSENSCKSALSEIREAMITTTANTNFDTFTLTMPKADVSLFKAMAKKMGWAIEHKSSVGARLYDPESGEYLNEETMDVIEKARKGEDVIEVGSMDDYMKLVNNL